MANPAPSKPVVKIPPPDRGPDLREQPPLSLPERGFRLREERGERRKVVRWIFLGLGPLALIAAGLYAYLAGGRYVSTEDAFIQADKIQVSADISGRVVDVPVTENQRVKKGDVLFRIDDAPFRFALAAARAKQQSARNEIEALKADYRQRLIDLKKSQETVAYSRRVVERNRGLTAKGFVTAQALDDAQHNLQVAEATANADRQAIAHDVAALGGNPDLPVEQQAAYLQAKAALDQAALDLQHTVVHAPVDGIVSKVTLREGDYVQTGQATFALVPSDRLWVEANYKETELTYVSSGQHASIKVDTYPGQKFDALVESIAPASGSEFALLPPQNASGNWVKVVQRIPVRLKITRHAGQPALRAGMSVYAEIDTGHKRTLGSLFTSIGDWLGL